MKFIFVSMFIFDVTCQTCINKTTNQHLVVSHTIKYPPKNLNFHQTTLRNSPYGHPLVKQHRTSFLCVTKFSNYTICLKCENCTKRRTCHFVVNFVATQNEYYNTYMVYISALDENIKLKTFFLIKKVSFYLYKDGKKHSHSYQPIIWGVWKHNKIHE